MPTLAQLTVGQTQKEVTVNEDFVAVSMAGMFANRPAATVGLNWGFYGGIIRIDGVLTVVADGVIVLPGSNNNFVEISRAGVITSNTSAFSPDKFPLFEVSTNASVITGTVDRRTDMVRFHGRSASIAVTTADVTLTAAQSRNETLVVSGALTADRNVIVPTLAKRYFVTNACTGGTAPLLFRLVIKTAAGAGVEIPRGVCAEIECDGTNVLACNPCQFVQTLPYAATLGAHDATNGERIIVGVLTGGITIPAPTNPRIGQRLMYTFTQDATGARVITWDAAFKKAADGAGIANQVAATAYLYNGTNWVQQGGAIAWF